MRTCVWSPTIQAYKSQGVPVAPGMKISYVVQDAKRYFVDTGWSASVIDAGYYQALLEKAWQEISYAMLNDTCTIHDEKCSKE